MVVVQSLSRVQLFSVSWTAAAPLSSTVSQSLHKLMSIELVMLSNHLIFCCPLLLLASIFTSIRVFSNESALCIRWPKYWSFSFGLSPSSETFATTISLKSEAQSCWSNSLWKAKKYWILSLLVTEGSTQRWLCPGLSPQMILQILSQLQSAKRV